MTSLQTLPIPEPIRSSIPTSIVVVDPAVAAKIGELLDEADTAAASIVDLDSHAEASAALDRVVATLDAVEAGRVSAKARPLDLGRQIDDAARPYLDTLKSAKARLELAIRGYERAAAERRRKLEDDRRRAELAAVEEAKALERKRAAEVEAARMAAETPAEVEAAEALAVTAEAEVAEVLARPAALPVAVAPKSAVLAKTKPVAVLVDALLVPISIAGVVVRPPDMAQIERLLIAGVPVPGCRLDEVEVLGTRRGRR